MVDMSTFVDAAHPRGTTGRFVQKQNEAPQTELVGGAREWLPAGGGCTCLVNPNPYTHYGIVEPGDALEPDPDCPTHFPRVEVPADDDAQRDWMERNEAWADDAAAGLIEQPDPDAGDRAAWVSGATPF